jgi:hypothetical protein
MDFNRAQQVLEALQAECPHTDFRHIEVWLGAITRAREALLELQIVEAQVTTPNIPVTESDAHRRLSSRKLSGARN